MTKTLNLTAGSKEFLWDGELFLCFDVAYLAFPKVENVKNVKFTLSNKRFKGSRKVDISRDYLGNVQHHFGKTSYGRYLFPRLQGVAGEFVPITNDEENQKVSVYFRLTPIEN